MTTATTTASVIREGSALLFAGVLDRASVPALWRACTPLLTGITRLELSGVDRVDSAGVALLAELSERAGIPEVDGSPAGLAELRRAYRLGPTLDLTA